jgi:hypothetical protein
MSILNSKKQESELTVSVTLANFMFRIVTDGICSADKRSLQNNSGDWARIKSDVRTVLREQSKPGQRFAHAAVAGEVDRFR